MHLKFKKSYDHIVANKPYDFTRLAEGLEDYPLYPYLKYAHFSKRINKVPEREISDFLSAYAQTPLAKSLRMQWLGRLSREKRWHKYVQNYQSGLGNQLACNNLQARIKIAGKQKALADQALLNDIKVMWLVGRSQVDECDPAFELLYKSPLMHQDLILERISLTMQKGNLGLAKVLAKRLNTRAQGKVSLWRKLHHRPEQYLEHKDLLADTPLNKKIVLHGIKRIARSNAGEALDLWTRLQRRYQFSPEAKKETDRTLTFAAVDQGHPDAGNWLDALQKRASHYLIQRHLLKNAIQTKDWERLEEWTRKPPAPDFNRLRWLYWRARALDKTGKTDAARMIYGDLANERDYYGFLAADRLGEEYNFNDQRISISQEERAGLMANPAIVRAYELRLLDMEQKARREWSFATGQMNSEELQKAAVLAHEWGWYDRTILTLGQAKAYDDLERRFPTPYKRLITKYANKHWVPRSIVYTLMRSESAFMHDAHSGAGARGLMQVMPATARQTAKKIGFPYKQVKQLYEPDVSVALGTAFLKQMLNRHDGRLILAAAAYNAGPHRVLRWRPEKGCVNGEEWVERILFTETRRYVRRALFYSVLYQSRLGEKVEPIRSHLKPVAAQGKTCKS